MRSITPVGQIAIAGPRGRRRPTRSWRAGRWVASLKDSLRAVSAANAREANAAALLPGIGRIGRPKLVLYPFLTQTMPTPIKHPQTSQFVANLPISQQANHRSFSSSSFSHLQGYRPIPGAPGFHHASHLQGSACDTCCPLSLRASAGFAGAAEPATLRRAISMTLGACSCHRTKTCLCTYQAPNTDR